MLRCAAACILGIVVGLGGLIGCKPGPQLIAPADVTSAQTFYRLVLRYYANEQARLRNAHAGDPALRYVTWDVAITVTQVRMTDATHGMVLYQVTERWDGETWGAEGRQPVIAHWEKTGDNWRIVSSRKGVPIKTHWKAEDPWNAGLE